MFVVVGGASGFLGSALVDRLHADGHRVARLVRHEAHSPEESAWSPAEGVVDHALIERADVVVNLSGAPIARWPWTPGYRQELLDSRIGATHTLASAIAETGGRPALLSASAMAYYGRDRGEEPLGETAGPGEGFLTHVTHEWEAAAEPAVNAGSRVCFLRTTNVMHRSGGALKAMLVPFRLGLGARLGDGAQYFSVISRDDWVSAVCHLATRPDASGPYNLASPEPVTNAEFTKALAAAVRRPAFARVPGFAITAVLGGLGQELLGSLRIVPAHLQREGFDFAHRTVEEVLAAALA